MSDTERTESGAGVLLSRALKLDWHIALSVVACTYWVTTRMSEMSAEIRNALNAIEQSHVRLEAHDNRIRAIETMAAERGPRLNAIEERIRTLPR